MNRFDIVEATFQPRDTSTLKQESMKWVGWRGRWSADWVIEDDGDYSDYVGQFAMGIMSTGVHPPFAWVPEQDLANIKKVNVELEHKITLV